MDMKIYHCSNPDENPLPRWMTQATKDPEPLMIDPVEQFKKNPDSFFPEFYKILYAIL